METCKPLCVNRDAALKIHKAVRLVLSSLKHVCDSYAVAVWVCRVFLSPQGTPVQPIYRNRWSVPPLKTSKRNRCYLVVAFSRTTLLSLEGVHAAWAVIIVVASERDFGQSKWALRENWGAVYIEALYTPWGRSTLLEAHCTSRHTVNLF